MFYHFFQERRPTPSSQLVVELLTQAKSHCPSWTPGQAGSNSAGCQPAPPGLCFGAQIPCVKGKVVETPLKSVGSVLLVIRQLSLSTTAQSPKQRIIQKPSSLWLSSSLMKYDYFGTISYLSSTFSQSALLQGSGGRSVFLVMMPAKSLNMCISCILICK